MLLVGLSLTAFAKQNNSDVKNTCEVSGGQWTESASGWACCWADWGCYGCVNNVCKMKCYNERCRKANGTVRPDEGVKPVKGLAPAGGKDPIIQSIKQH